MTMDWFSFLASNHIPYTLRGPNASPGRVQIKCPFCGTVNPDPSEHLGIKLRDGSWNCWRNRHEGIAHTPQRLVQALLHCSIEEAHVALGSRAPALFADSTLHAELSKAWSERFGTVSTTKTLTFPKNFRPLEKPSALAAPFRNYLYGRDYSTLEVEWLAKTYSLQYTRQGKWAWRIIVPIFDRHKRLLSWTARAIAPGADLRYLSLRAAEALVAPKRTLLNLPLLWKCSNPRVLVICEGPFDAMRITTFGAPLGVYATCLFGLTLQTEQASLIADLATRFNRQVVLLDQEACAQAFCITYNELGLELANLPKGVKDPGEMTSQQVINFCLSVLK